MKKRNIYILFLSLFVVFGLTSCLNDPAVDNLEYGLTATDISTNKIIEIPSSASHVKNIVSLDEGVKEFDIEIRLAAAEPASEDIVVNLEMATDTAAIIAAVRKYQSDKYPATGEDSIPDEDILPFNLSGIIDMPATVTIPKGERSVILPLKIDTHALTAVTQFALLKITGVDKSGYMISGNFGELLLSTKVKNKYAGEYMVTGIMTDSYSSSLVHVSEGLVQDGEDMLVDLETVDGSTVVFGYSPTFDTSYYYLIYTGSSFSSYGSFCPQFTFDSEGNITAVTNYYGQPASNTRSAEIDPSGVNKYDEATKSFTVSYWMNQSSVITTPPYHRTHIVETYTSK